jgi:hypothetical protein
LMRGSGCVAASPNKELASSSHKMSVGGVRVMCAGAATCSETDTGALLCLSNTVCVARVLSRMHGRMGKHRDRACDDGCDMLQVCVRET